jgi:2-C-methyl-D-erythritol 4-phosphate cytidylyltransferase
MSQMPLKSWALLTAGGQSQRFQTDAKLQGLTFLANKLLNPLEGVPVLVHSLRALLVSMPFAGLIVTAPKNAMAEFQVIIEALQAEFPQTPLFLVEGGSNRRASVYAGLHFLSSITTATLPEFVVIHDGARPLLPPHFLPLAMQQFQAFPHLHGVIAGFPLKDTIKRVRVESHTNRIESTVARQKLWAVQTPQVFRFQALWHAHQSVAIDDTITDDAELIERHLGPQASLCVLPCSQQNLKITTPEDLDLARFWLNTASK